MLLPTTVYIFYLDCICIYATVNFTKLGRYFNICYQVGQPVSLPQEQGRKLLEFYGAIPTSDTPIKCQDCRGLRTTDKEKRAA